jgi:D,D-heptose 1,7-bisphosphate phosphatase
MLDIDIDSLISFHAINKAAATIIAHPNDHPFDSDLIKTDADNKVTAFHSKPHEKNTYYRNLVNAGVYILSPKIFTYIPQGNCCDFGKDIFPKLLESGERIYAYRSAEYIKDIGTIERLKEVEQDLHKGKVTRLNRDNKRKAIFLDRDGVINHEVDMLQSPNELRLLPGAAEAISKINKSGYLAIVITNQPQIAKGFINERQLNYIHAKLETELGQNHAYLDRIYYCPHHPQKGYEGEIEELKIECNCRKPNTGLIEKAVKEFNIDTEHSFFIGDRTVDIMTGINAGLTTILVRTGFAGKDEKYQCEPDFVFENLFEAVSFIFHKHDSLIKTPAGSRINNGELT